VTLEPGVFEPWAWDRSVELLVTAPDRSASLPPEPWTLQSQQLLQDALADHPASPASIAAAEALLSCGDSVSLQQQADALRQELVGETVTYVVNRNLNFTNHCVQHCSFCAFRRDAGAPGAYWHDLDLLRSKAAEAAALGATELCIQGGLNPAARTNGSALRYYVDLLEALRDAAPGLHLHAFSPQELLFIAEQDRIALQAVLEQLRSAGLASIPGTAAEVLSDGVRAQLCPEKISARQWCAVILQCHRLGLASTATLMAGHIESARDRALHLLTLVALQQEALRAGQAGFSEFVLLPFIGAQAPAALRHRVGRDQPDRLEMLLLTAQARLLLGPWFRNHQPSWVKLTLAGATEALRWGCNDLGGTLMEESITSMAGAQGGTCQSVQALRSAALTLGRPVRERTTLYGAVS
jgi:FO synthase subunit 2